MTQTIAPRARNLVLLLLAVAGALLAGAAPASAHAALTGSDPRQGAVVQQAPAQVTLTFSESVAVGGDSLRVLDPKGNRVDTGDPTEVSGTTYAVKLHSGLPDGTYTVTYQVVSADSHPVAGAYTFSVGAPSSTTVSVTGQEAGGGLVGGLYGFGRYVSYAGFIVLVGGAAFVLACWPAGAGVRAVQRVVVAGWLALTAATLWLLLLRGAYTTSGKAGDILDLDLLGQVLQTKTGAALVSRLLLLAAAALFIAVLFGAWDKREAEEKRDLTFGLAVGGGVVAAGLAASWAMAEHASTGLQPGIAMPVDVLHLLAVAAWLGGLTALLVALYRAPAGTPVAAVAVRRFSAVAFGSVVVLAATGTYQSWRQLGSWSAFTGTRYGQYLLAKIGLVALLVGIAWISRRWTGRLRDAAALSSTGSADDGELEKVGADGRAGEGTGKGRAPADARGAEGAGSGRGSAGVRTGTRPVAADPDSASGTDPDGGTDPERAAQLARQRAVMEAARRKRERDADPERSGLRRSVLAEACVAVVLLAVTTALTQTEPGRTEEAARAAASSAPASSAAPGTATGAVTLDMPFDTGGKDGQGVVTIDLDPARVGANEMHVYVTHPDGSAWDIPEVKIAFTLEAKDIGPLPVVPDHITTGHWSASGVQLPVAGDWKVAVTVRTSDIDQVTVAKNAKIG
ncbi:copper resistance protein CopC [Streptomyces sp. XM83C]|uniref:copper resistance CopC/CopD family protein n=1 Tax=Streptomyces sp. XM83C TaxID=2929781 RepID=UPI001FF73107|nr:copper resistance protein CopC [Streptomyces sp. XM83C]MCK1820957.1 copper resistance protein CopC [Streptomyces sp. XM83C]